MTDCEIKVPEVFVERAMRQRSAITPEMATLIEHRLGEYEELMGCLSPRGTEARIASTLAILARKFGEPEGGGTVIGLRLTRGDLAAMISATRESATAAVSLGERGLLTMEAGRVVIRKPEGLAELGRG